jgi:transposase
MSTKALCIHPDSITRTKLSPPMIAARFGVSPEKVIGWIRRGELRAIDVATRRGRRPRYLVDVNDLAAFERSRHVEPVTKSVRRRRSPRVISFF